MTLRPVESMNDASARLSATSGTPDCAASSNAVRNAGAARRSTSPPTTTVTRSPSARVVTSKGGTGVIVPSVGADPRSTPPSVPAGRLGTLDLGDELPQEPAPQLDAIVRRGQGQEVPASAERVGLVEQRPQPDGGLTGDLRHRVHQIDRGIAPRERLVDDRLHLAERPEPVRQLLHQRQEPGGHVLALPGRGDRDQLELPLQGLLVLAGPLEQPQRDPLDPNLGQLRRRGGVGHVTASGLAPATPRADRSDGSGAPVGPGSGEPRRPARGSAPRTPWPAPGRRRSRPARTTPSW